MEGLARLQSLLNSKTLIELTKSGHIELSYASSYSYRISEYLFVEECRPVVEGIIFCLVDKLVPYLTSREISGYDQLEFAKMIIHQYGRQISISGVAHWVHLLQTSQPPFDLEIMGFQKRVLLLSLSRYLQEMRAWINEKNKQSAEAVSLAEQQYGLAKALRNNHTQLKRIRDLSARLSAKYPDEAEQRRRASEQTKKLLKNK